MKNTCFALCNCNDTAALDVHKLSKSLAGATLITGQALCRQETGRVRGLLEGSDAVVVGCTQEAPLFKELADAAKFSAPLRFVNLREFAGWSDEAAAVTAKMAALLAQAVLPEPAPVAAVSLSSHGALLLIGPAEAALDWAERLKDELDVSVLLTRTSSSELPSRHEYPIFSGADLRITGHLGAFQVHWRQENPIDLERCTRCNACVRACPEAAINHAYQIDLSKCRDHRVCVTACGAIGAIDFARAESQSARSENYDLILDFCAEPLLRLPHPPQGYFAPGREALAQSEAVRMLLKLVGDFEKPQYFDYREKLCAHARNEIAGCQRCLDVCSTGAITSKGNGVLIDAALCQGCGGCATTCPSGAVRHAYPRVSDLGRRLKAMLAAYREAGGDGACILLHDARHGRERLLQMARLGRGLPARVIPFEVYDVAACGLDLLLGALVYGAAQCVILSDSEQPAAYAAALRQQVELGATILAGLNYAGKRLIMLDLDEPQSLETALWSLPRLDATVSAATFHLSDDKRSTLEFEIDHLLTGAEIRTELIELPAGAPWGEVRVDQQKCTLCLACVGACPASALLDSPEMPRLSFIERLCLQCGLCVNTCPEQALSLKPRLLLGAAARRTRLLIEAEPFCCVRCGKPFGARKLIDAMVARLTGHSMFAAPDALQKLQMCADCRVIEMLGNQDELNIFPK